MSTRTNLSALALKYSTLTVFFMLALSIAGVWAFINLGRAEDPPFTIKQMVVSAAWPGATSREVEQQVTDKIETKLQELPYFFNVTSYTKPGETVIYVSLRDDVPPARVADLWYQVRKKVGDIRGSLPQGVVGPFFNDEYGDTYSLIWAFESDGFSSAEVKDIVKAVRQRVLRVPDVTKADLFGLQDEKIYIEFSHTRLAMLGVPVDQILDVIRKQNSIVASGTVETRGERVAVRVDGAPTSAADLANLPFNANGRTLTLADVAEIRRGYQDPTQTSMRFKGKAVIGLGVVMAPGGNVQTLGKALEATMAEVERELPVGITVHRVANQPEVVDKSFEEFTSSLLEALAIVLVVSFISLGVRTGIIVALSVPLVLAITFVAMLLLGIDFQRISLGALIIALGLLVDDAIIAVEMMMVKLEQGFSRMEAATFAYTSTAFPMLTGTLVTAAGFVPVGFAKSSAGEYTNSIFWVVGISLIVSWFVAVLFTPWLGYRLLPQPKVHHADPYQGRLYTLFRRVLVWCVTWRKTTIAITALAFLGSMGLMGLVQKQFFPTSNRPELIVDMRLAQGASFAATNAEVKKLEALLGADPDVSHYTAYVGAGSPRFYLPTVPELANASFGQIIVMTKDLEARERVLAALDKAFAQDFEAVRARVQRLQNGPPVSYPVMFRVLGDDPQQVRAVAEKVRQVFKADPATRDINFDWNELAKTVRLEVDQNKARALGVDSQLLGNTLQTLLSGVVVTQYRDRAESIDVIARAVPGERLSLEGLEAINLRTANGGVVSLAQLATLRFELEEPILWRRNKDLLMTVRAGVIDGVQGPDVAARIDTALAPVRAELPAGYRIEVGGDKEESARSQGSIFKMMPVMAFLMVLFLMLQLQSFSKLALVMLTAPLGMIGVALFLLAFNQPFGFVSLLGTIALAGMIMRNSVILVDQIDQDIEAGHSQWDAVIDATVRRARPILLTAGTAIFAMVPLSRSVFFGPMAVALMGGLLVATALTLLFLPALYAAWFRVKQPKPVEIQPMRHVPPSLALAAE
ncbi:MAG: efflux RND transporter permease subunit [Reyranella sp.]|uniref:efflux RND transporter permease subunit n=1 Tax=Reyranella sp. TaxID=1929291 RepID=UPI0012108045|nr:efflux RND transporter permease subunit [Reyranella sp.]TAJ42937.1 MAG: efflux RND transporter permease subunit [Reyranella sp.]